MFRFVKEKAKRVRELGLRESGVRLGHKLFKRSNPLPSIPPTVFIELTNNCNLNCLMCDRESMTRKTGFIDMDLYRKIIDNASRIGISDIKLNRFGEPFIHPSLAEMVRYAKSKSIPRVYFTSNATLLTEKNTRALLEAGLDGIAFSVDGANKETYKKIRNADFDKVTRNIERFCQIKKEMGMEKPRVQLNTILMNETEHEMMPIFQRWNSIVDYINVLPVAQYGNVPDLSTTSKSQKQLRACEHPFDRLMVFWNGDVTVCCGDINGELKIGNIHESPLEELWTNKRISSLRRIHQSKRFDKIPLCQHCDGTNADAYKQMYRQQQQIYKKAEELGL